MAQHYDDGILEQRGRGQSRTLLEILLQDRTTEHNLLWATSDYAEYGNAFQEDAQIMPEQVSGSRCDFIQPRTAKTVENQASRTRQKAEVFTPCWICNAQNNLIDQQWFHRENVFNTTDSINPTIWIPTTEKITFPTERLHSWENYVDERRMEVCCGEAPYLVSRYDSISGEEIPVPKRIGMLDRKLRVVGENTTSERDWLKWTLRTFQSVYGFEYQGDSLFLARKNLFYTFLDYYDAQYSRLPNIDWLCRIANVISWNLWQMDGLKLVVPGSCKTEQMETQTIFGESVIEESPCPGCRDGGYERHTGTYCMIKNWRSKTKQTFLSVMKEGSQRGRTGKKSQSL